MYGKFSGGSVRALPYKSAKSALEERLFLGLCVLSRFSCVQLSVAPRTIVLQAPLSMEFSRQEYWSGLPCLPPGDLSDLGMESASLTSPALAGRFLYHSCHLGSPIPGPSYNNLKQS